MILGKHEELPGQIARLDKIFFDHPNVKLIAQR
jgi:hypothetical protein